MGKILRENNCKEKDIKDSLECFFGKKVLKCKKEAPAKKKDSLFGYGEIKTDYYCENEDCIIEIKYIRNKNEYEIKNGLSQIIEQALCMKEIGTVKNAILLIIDAGRASKKLWNTDTNEGKFISMFQKNPFNINLIVLRIRIVECAVDKKHEILRTKNST